MRKMNEILLMKIAYNMLNDNKSLWVQVLRNKYKCGSNIIPIIVKQNNLSNLWRGIIKIRPKLMELVEISQSTSQAKVKWKKSSDGSFIVKSTYSYSLHSNLSPRK